ncbi:hypothetical protein CONPUDRAFT_170010 [Coniophora puteana RWD-64-598 SS2]|uniref:HNH nuclease domain-containing protein n=1 Tax=Coniophora puteana (strain RWD-64-598) TaxID=741705 RepID=R7SEP8_CONPW|nr:uncharacterized protein CONPUDRAFT_170010 [Coniophora puteana RWD-64-598 SS2]EIW74656.1 hypothetical protein CONPUDRAFT_170010 [Coniophora puteana RWD-64-598 SS2]
MSYPYPHGQYNTPMTPTPAPRNSNSRPLRSLVPDTPSPQVPAHSHGPHNHPTTPTPNPHMTHPYGQQHHSVTPAPAPRGGNHHQRSLVVNTQSPQVDPQGLSRTMSVMPQTPLQQLASRRLEFLPDSPEGTTNDNILPSPGSTGLIFDDDNLASPILAVINFNGVILYHTVSETSDLAQSPEVQAIQDRLTPAKKRSRNVWKGAKQKVLQEDVVRRGRCLITLEAPFKSGVDLCHLMPNHMWSNTRVLAQMKLAWGYRKGVNLDTRYNLIFLRKDIHWQFDHSSWMLVPVPEDIHELLIWAHTRKEDKTNHQETYKQRRNFRYIFVAIDFENPIGRLGGDNIIMTHPPPYYGLGIHTSHAHPNYVLYDACNKYQLLEPRRQQTVQKNLQEVLSRYRQELRIDANALVDDAWGMGWRRLNIGSPLNALFLNSTIVHLFNDGEWLIIPELSIIEKLYDEAMKTYVSDPIKLNKYFRHHCSGPYLYYLIPRRSMRDEVITETPSHRRPRTVHTYPFATLGPFRSHIRPHYVAWNLGEKLDEVYDSREYEEMHGSVREILALHAPHLTAIDTRKHLDMVSVATFRWKQERHASLWRPVQRIRTTKRHRPEGELYAPEERTRPEEEKEDSEPGQRYVRCVSGWALDVAESVMDASVLNDDQVAEYRSELEVPSPPPTREAWCEWRRAWRRCRDTAQDTSRFSSNDWAVVDFHVYLPTGDLVNT